MEGFDQKKLDFFARLGEREFTDWLTSGIKNYYSKDEDIRRLAFSPLHYYIGHSRDGDLTVELRDIYKRFPDEIKNKFFRSIAAAFSDKSLPSLDEQVTNVLFFLASDLKVIEVLDPFEKIINSDFLDKMEDNLCAVFFSMMLSVVVTMSPTKGVADLLRLMALNKCFAYGGAPLTLIALCYTEPNEFAAHMSLLRESLNRFYTENGTKNAYMTAFRVLKLVPEDVISRFDFQEEDEWLKEFIK